ncbi:cysteine proteinase [Hypoxylon sp. FL1284]|nr:cysteine proteinase [Hypoxylon sp. FL1284]
MPKPSHLSGVIPTNRLNGSSPSRFDHTDRSHPPPSSLHPQKRQKVENGVDHSLHTPLQFAPKDAGQRSDRDTSRKRSHDSISDTQQTSAPPSFNANVSQTMQTNLKEFREVYKYTNTPRKRPRTNLHESHSKQRTDGEVDKLSLADTLGDSDEEVDVISLKAKVTHPGQQKEEEQPIDELRSRFNKNQTRASHRVNDSIDAISEKRDMRKGMDSSPDELALEAGDMRGKKPTVQPSTPSPSVSKRGAISSTHFETSSSPEMKQAKNIIGERLHVSQAVSGSFKHEACKTSGADECYLQLGTVSNILEPVNSNGEYLDKYSYCMVNIQKAKIIHYAMESSCSIVSIPRALDATAAGNQKLVLEFQSREGLDRFIKWARLSGQADFKDEDSNTLRRTLANLMQKAQKSTAIKDSEGVDMSLIEHNRAMRPTSAYQRHRPNLHPKRKDLMKPPAVTGSLEPTAAVQEPRRHNPPRHLRTTRAAFVVRDSPEPTKSPGLDGWSVRNRGWEKQWRNSLVFPPHGKSRATVDKEDIPRLDEGEFLNDNLLIFYLRYLQHTLEAKRPDLAQRIYFQNTYFYEKLRSQTTSKGNINYDSVKAWTSKVDLFTKDFIIVPINESAHWYVVIIYNAPKLLLSQGETEVHNRRAADTITIKEDAADSGEVSRASSQSRRPDEHAGADPSTPSVNGDVAKKLSPTDQESQQADVQFISRRQDIEEISDTSDSRADLKPARPSSSIPGKKAGKRPSKGSRKLPPDQPRIITLDSLALAHSHACKSLKEYLIAELKDKKGLELLEEMVPGGMTAKDVPQQTNYCDCGLYLLGYIEEFLKDPDKFVYSLLQRQPIDWDLNPSDLRNSIRDSIFELQKEQQVREDAHKLEKRRAAQLKKRKSEEYEEQVPEKQAVERQVIEKQEVEKRAVEKQVADQAVPVTPVEEAVAIEDDNVPLSRTDSSTTEGSRPEPAPSSRCEESRHMPSSYPVSPSTVREEVTHLPAAADTDTAEQRQKTPKLISPLPGTSPRSSPVKPLAVDDSEISCEQKQEPNNSPSGPEQASVTTEVAGRSSQHVQAHDEENAEPRKERETPTTSPHFAGRQPGDRMASAKLREQPVEQDIINVSDSD